MSRHYHYKLKKMSSNTTGVSTNPKLSASERLDRIKTAWERVAPDARFANLSVVEFTAAIADFQRQLHGLDCLKAGLKAGVGDHRTTAKAARKLIGRVVSGVLADTAYGPDSALYRAMGYVRASERKSPRASGPVNDAGAPGASAVPRRVGLKQRLEMVLSAWNELATEQKFAGMTMTDFQLALNPYTQARSAVEATRTRIKAEVATKAGTESAARKLAQRIVASVRADAAYGDDSSLYRAMGYRPASERRSPKRTAAGEAAVGQSEPGAATGSATGAGAGAGEPALAAK